MTLTSRRLSDFTSSPSKTITLRRNHLHLLLFRLMGGKPNTTHDEDLALQNYGTDAKSELPENN